MKNFLLVLSLILTVNSFGQDLGNYGYVVVPEKFSFLKEADQYQLNSLTKFLFEKYGFEAFVEGGEELANLNPDRCEGLYANVLDDSGFLRTKVRVELKDCSNRQVFISQEGESREKVYKAAYQEALREAFKSIEALKFQDNEVIVSGTPDLKVQGNVKEKRNAVSKSSDVQVTEGKKKNSAESQIEPKGENKGISASKKATNINLQRDGKNYFLQKNNYGFNLYHKGTTEPFATLIRSSAGNSFIYNSITSKGIACLDNEGNLIIEILKEDGNSLETIVYNAADQ